VENRDCASHSKTEPSNYFFGLSNCGSWVRRLGAEVQIPKLPFELDLTDDVLSKALTDRMMRLAGEADDLQRGIDLLSGIKR
jgi:hypothetical protein